MLILRHRNGSLKGREQSIQDKDDRIIFGRDPDVCDVVFPADETLVARRHFALERKLSGAWTFDLFGDPFVAVNGEPVESSRALHKGDIVELGKRGGPSFEVVHIDEAMTSRILAETQVQEKVTNQRVAVASAKRMAIAGAALAVIVAVGAASAVYFWSAGQGARLNEAVAALADSQAKVAAQNIGQPVREKLLAASFLVYVRQPGGEERPLGSASPIGPNLLATNAHIAVVMEELRQGQKLFVKAPGSAGRTFEVIEAKPHPGYKEFEKFLESDPLYVTSTKGCPTCISPILAASGGAYDVATLRVADGAALSPILEIATEQDLAGLQPGTPLAMSGYPLEEISSNRVQSVAATPTLSIGMVSANTDFFSLPADIRQRRLIQHNLPGTGGNSGSPVVTSNGKIVGLHNAGSYIMVPNVGRVPNAAMVRYAQRSDTLADLVAGRAEASLAEDRTYWAKQTAGFKRGIDYLIPEIIARSKPSANANAVASGQSKHMLVKADAFAAKDKDNKDVTRRQKIHPITLKAGRPITVIAYASDRAAIQAYLVIDGKIADKDERRIWFPSVDFKPESDIKADVYVVGPDQDVNYQLLEYVWDVPRS
jgi:hypothetical protein